VTGSLLDSLRAKRERLAASKTTDIPIPGYGGELVVRYRLCDPLVEGKQIGDRLLEQFKGADQESERMYFMFVDTLIAACDGIFVKVGDELVSLDEEGDTIDYGDPRLGEFLGFTADTARDAVLAVFGDNKIAVTQHGRQLQLWMGDTTGELNRSTLG
jgi:hypothetical protein